MTESDITQETSSEDKKKSGLKTRIISALVMLPIAIYIILTGGMLFTGLITVLSLLILLEWNKICEGRSLNAAFFHQAVLLLFVIYDLSVGQSIGLYNYYIWGGIAVSLVIVSFKFKLKPHFAVLGAIYALLPAVSLIWLRIIFNDSGWIVLWTMIIVWSMDTGAYFVGKNIGSPKMAPKISPNKTWSGLIGGATAATLIGVLVAYLLGANDFGGGFHAMMLAPFAAVLAVWSQIGDLAESALKRHFDVKDSGAIIPGHGGIMDRVDGVVFAAPAVALVLYLAS